MEFQLIDDAKLGDWKIVLDVEGQLTTQQFKVQEYGERITFTYPFLMVNCKHIRHFYHAFSTLVALQL